MERRDAQNGRDGAAAAQLRRHSSSFAVAVPSQQQFRRSNSSVAAAALSQQQLRRSSSSVASSAPSQQHQLRRGRDAQNERDGAGLRSSVAAATPSQSRCCDSVAASSQQRCAHHEHPSGKFATFHFWKIYLPKTPRHHHHHQMIKPCFFKINLPKSSGHSPDRRRSKIIGGGFKKSCVWVVTHRFVFSRVKVCTQYPNVAYCGPHASPVLKYYGLSGPRFYRDCDRNSQGCLALALGPRRPRARTLESWRPRLQPQLWLADVTDHSPNSTARELRSAAGCRQAR